jgi:hypothetical protein
VTLADFKMRDGSLNDGEEGLRLDTVCTYTRWVYDCQ